MKNIILLTLMIANVLWAQKLPLGNTNNMIEFSHTKKNISLELQSGANKEMIWSKPITYESNSSDFAFKSTVYPTANDSRINPYKGAKIIHADFKDLGDDSWMCLVLIEIDYNRSAFLTAQWIGPVLPKKYGYRPITILGDVYGKKNYLLRSFIKNEGKWRPYLSCYLDSVWYDLIGVPFETIRILSKNIYAVTYKHGRRLVKYDRGKEFSVTYTPEPGFDEDDGGDVIVDGRLIRKTLMNTKAPVTRELEYNDKVGFLQVNDSGELKYAAQAVWWKGFDEFTYYKKFDENSLFLSEEDKIDMKKANEKSYFMVRQSQKDRIPDTAIKYEPPVIRVADNYMNALFDIVKFREEKGRKPFTKEEIMRLADAKFKDKNDLGYKKDIEIKLSKPSYQSLYFYEE